MRVRLLAEVSAALDSRKSPGSIKMLTGSKHYCCSFNPAQICTAGCHLRVKFKADLGKPASALLSRRLEVSQTKADVKGEHV